MVMEIEKMTRIQEMVSKEEAVEIRNIINTLSNDFSGITEDSRHYILTGERVTRDFSDSIFALKRMKAYGERFGIDFPNIETDEQAAIYILKFGKEIVKS